MTLRTTLRLKHAMLDKVDKQYPLVVDIARQNIEKSKQNISGDIQFEYLNCWGNALSDKETLIRMIEDTSEEGLSAWQVAPFAGVFSSEERWLILKGDG